MKILAVDVGRGTQDILLYSQESELENSIQLILPSRTVLLAQRLEEATRLGQRAIFHGVTMGGGPVKRAARRHIESGAFLAATPGAAATFSDDPGELEEMGVHLVEENEALSLAGEKNSLLFETADVHLGSLRASLKAWGVKADFDMAAVSVQDHGAPPPHESNRRYRFQYFRESLGKDPRLPVQCHSGEEVPARFTRMLGVRESLSGYGNMIIMDTGFAAILGACLDHLVAPHVNKALINIGNGHTLAALVEGMRIRSLFEHHTGQLTPSSFNALLDELADGAIEDHVIFKEGGHGAYRDGEPYGGHRSVEIWSLTGPRRQPFAEALEGAYQAAPFGSMMQCGCFGLLAAFFWRYPDLSGPGEEKFLAPLEDMEP
jgi:uncharacterized protein (DUF1786 family)